MSLVDSKDGSLPGACIRVFLPARTLAKHAAEVTV
jgi:hypothetical protein